MAARLARAKATLLTPTQELQGVSIVVRANEATVRLGAEIVLHRAAVARVVPEGRRSWSIHFDGSPEIWTVTDERRRCCGRT